MAERGSFIENEMHKVLLLQAALYARAKHRADPQAKQRLLRADMLRRKHEINRCLSFHQISRIKRAVASALGDWDRVEKGQKSVDGREHRRQLIVLIPHQ